MDADCRRRVTVHRHDDALGRWTVAWCRPHPALQPYVDMLWFGEGHTRYSRDRILPSGTSYLLINLGPLQYRIEPGPPERRVPFADVWYSGLHHAAIDTEAPHGNALLGVALSAAGTTPWLGVDADDLANRITPLSDLLGDRALALRERLLETGSIEARFDLVEQWLRRRLDPKRRPHAAVEYALQRIAASAGQLAVEDLAHDCGISRKQLGTLFRRQVGLTPKALARVHRFRTALAMLSGLERVPWTELAAHCGYFDQSHLIRDFRAFSGFAPGEFVRRARPDGNSVVVR